jgi:quinol monooxygenase YgiN
VPGCLSYVVADDPTDANGIWITEVWNPARLMPRRSNGHPFAVQSPKVAQAKLV